MRSNLFVALLAMFFLASFGLFAAETPATTAQQGLKDVKTSIAEKTNMTVEQINTLKTKGYGYGEIMILSEISKESNQSVETIMADRTAGMGWGQIANKYSVKFSNALTNCTANLNTLDKEYKNNSDLREARMQVRNARRDAGKVRAERAIEKRQGKLENKKQMMEKKQQRLEERKTILEQKREEKADETKSSIQEADKNVEQQTQPENK